MRMGPTTSRRAWAGASAVALVVGVVAGCSGGNAKPGPSATAAPATPTASPTPTPTASPTPDASVKPVRPAAMDQVSAAGAEAVAVYFLQLYPYVYASGDLTEWKALSDPECVFCKSVIDNVEALHAKGGSDHGSEITFHSIKSSEITAGYWFAVEAALTEGPSVERDAAGQIVSERTAPKDFDMTLAITFVGTWTIRELDVVEKATG